MQPGDVVAERFVVKHLAGSGGMGAVFHAEDRLSGEAIALKVAYSGGFEDRERLDREADILQSVAGERIVRYIAHGTHGSCLYLALEWLAGEDLERRLARGGLAVDECLTLGAHLAAALATIHAGGVIHRDIKPSNVFLVDGCVDRLKLLDFGTARALDFRRLTATGDLLGTPLYMSPEQVQSEVPATCAADVYALGVVLYECLTGDPPHRGASLMEVFSQVLWQEAAPVSSLRAVPAEVDGLIAAALAKAPNERPAAAWLEARLRAAATRAAVNEARAALGPTQPADETRLEELRRRTVAVVLPPGSDQRRQQTTVRMDDLSSAVPMAEITALAATYGIRIEPVAGVGVVAIPEGHSHCEARAARFSLALSALNPELAIAIGTPHTAVSAEAAVGLGGSAVEHALALLGAGPGVWIDEATAALLRHGFRAKAGAAGLRLVEAIGPQTATVPIETAPLCGREGSLAQLIAMLERVVARRQPEAVMISGEAGVGKSRLARELMLWLARDERSKTVAVARADPLATASPYALATQVLRQIVPAAQEEDFIRVAAAADATPEAIARGIALLVDDAGIQRDGDLTSLAASAVADDIRRAFVATVQAEALRVDALVVFVEDLHWGDQPSVRLFRQLLDLVASPLFVVGMARPEARSEFAELWQDERVRALDLAPLNAAASRALVQAIAPALPEPQIDSLIQRADGNAFFLQELARAARDGRSDLPDSVIAVAEARLERLPPEARRILRAASVFGDEFSEAAIVALLGDWYRAVLEGELARLLDEGVVRRRRREIEHYEFAHEMLREAAYAALAPNDRLLAHGLAASWLEQQPDVDAMVLAEQWRRSHRPARAVHWFERAARRALAGHDFATALQCVADGLALEATATERARLHTLAAEAYEWATDDEQREKHGLLGMAAAELGTPEWFGAFLHALLPGARLRGEAAIAPLVDMLAELPETRRVTIAEVIALARSAGQLLMLGDYPRGHALLGRAEGATVALSARPRELSAWLDWARAWQALTNGKVMEAYRYDLSTWHHFEAANDLRNTAYAATNVGYEQMRLGLIEAAEETLLRALETCERLGLSMLTANALHNLSLVCALLGRLDDGRRYGERAVALSERIGHPRFHCNCLDYLGRVALICGDAEAALAASRQAIACVADSPKLATTARATEARALLQLGDAEAALTASRRAVEALGDRHSDGDHVYVRAAHLASLLAVGDRDSALSLLEQLVEELHEEAAKIDEPDVRHAFLTRIPEHQRILQWATRLGVPLPVT